MEENRNSSHDVRQTRASWLAVLAGCISLFGAGVGILLTILKFISDHTCWRGPFSICEQGPQFSCERAFNSSWSTVGGIPVTIYATAFYLTALFVCFVIVRRRSRYMGVGWHSFLVLAVADIIASIMMATYSATVLGAFCLYCMLLYAVSVLFALCVLFGHRLQRDSGLPAVDLGKRSLRAAAVLAVVFSMALLPQALAYESAKEGRAGLSSCYVPTPSLPETTLRAGASHPRWILAEFVDSSCSHCRSQFLKLHRLLEDPALKDQLEVRVYHYPRDGADPCAPNGFSVRSGAAMSNNACLAALAVQCAEQLRRDAGTAMLARVFSLQDTAPPWFTFEKIAGEARLIDLDPHALVACMRNDAIAPAVVRGHIRYGTASGLEATPRLYAIPSQPGGTTLMVEGDKDVSFLRRILR